jgi:hypothetical protein
MRVGGVLARAALAVVFLAGAAETASAVAVTGITVNTYAEFSRVTIEISGPAKPIVVPFAAEPETGKPDRLAVDFETADLEIPGPTRIEVGDGRIRSVRFGRTPSGGVRVVLDLVRAARHRGLRHTHPPRIELDVLGEALQGPAAAP